MLINFNVKRLDQLLYDFYSLTGLTISVWDANFCQLSFQPKEMRSFCRSIKKSEKGRKLCFESDKAVCMECGELGKPVTHYCHAGLLDTAVPIKFKDSVIGYIMFGQIKDSHLDNGERFKKLSRDLQIDYDDLISSYKDLAIYDKQKIESAANILKMATRYLWLSQYINIGYNAIASQLDDYIRANIGGEISVTSICSAFGISKNRLYDISHEWFKMPIGEYITAVRIEKAKNLLTSTTLPISQIAVMIGINDYNYFTKFFKSQVGTPPLKYRKGFPFDFESEK